MQTARRRRAARAALAANAGKCHAHRVRRGSFALAARDCAAPPPPLDDDACDASAGARARARRGRRPRASYRARRARLARRGATRRAARSPACSASAWPGEASCRSSSRAAAACMLALAAGTSVATVVLTAAAAAVVQAAALAASDGGGSRPPCRSSSSFTVPGVLVGGQLAPLLAGRAPEAIVRRAAAGVFGVVGVAFAVSPMLGGPPPRYSRHGGGMRLYAGNSRLHVHAPRALGQDSRARARARARRCWASRSRRPGGQYRARPRRARRASSPPSGVGRGEVVAVRPST